MRNGQAEREAVGHDRVASALALALFGVLVAAGVVVVVFARAEFGRSPIVGTWVSRDDAGVEVVYQFAADGMGYRQVGGASEDLTWDIQEGYPNELRVRIPVGGDTADYRGLVEFVSDARIRLELGPRGGPAPRRLDTAALDLRRPPTR